MRCKTIDQVATAVLEIIADEQAHHPEEGVEFFFRGESCNFRHRGDPSAELDSTIPSCVDRVPIWRERERDLYHEALRLNVASFHDDRTMVERIARMQHYGLPTRFADASTNVLAALHFALGGGNLNVEERMKDEEDGFVRVLKVSHNKMKTFTSDIITAIAHLPLVKPEDVKPSVLNGLEVLRYEITNERPGFSMNIRQDASAKLMEYEKQLRQEIQQVWAFKPIWNTLRIRNQDGIFLAYGCRDGKAPLNPNFSRANYNDPNAPSHGIVQIGYVQIAAEAKNALREQMRWFGFPIEAGYPDLSDVCREISQRMKQEGAH